MQTLPTRILLVEDNPGDARLIWEMLAETNYGNFEIEWVTQLSQGLKRLPQGDIDLVLLDLGLPDSQGLETFIRAYDYSSELPIIVLTGQTDETLGLAALRRGAQDYLIKGKVDGHLLSRAIRYAIERRRSQEALWAERLRLFSLLETMPAMVYVKAPDYAIRFANRRFEDLFGAWEGKRCFEAIYGRTTPCEVCQAFKILETQKAQEWELTWPHNDRTYQTYHYPFIDIDGGPLILTMGIDITDRKRAEKALQRQQEELQMILDSVPAMIFYKDQQDRFIKVNKALAEVTGLAVEEIEGKTAAEIYHEQDYWQDDLEVITSGNPKRNIIEPIQTAVGKRWLHTDKIPYRDEGANIAGIIGFALDITERRQAEAAIKEQEDQLATIYENAPLIMVLVDGERRICRVNKLAEQFARAPAEELIGRRGGEVLRCLHALDDPQGCGFGRHCQQCTVRGTILDTFATGHSYHQVEGSLPFVIAGKTQEVTFLLCTARLQVQGQFQVLVTIQDISARKRMEEVLRASEQKLRFLTAKLLTAQEDECKRLSQELHDELGHALLAMKLDLGAMEKQLPPEQTGLAENIRELMGYIDEVMENVRRLYLDLTPGDLEDLGLTAALKNLCQEFGRHHKKIYWSVNLENLDTLFPLRGQIAVYRIFQEILTNIGKHADPTRVEITGQYGNGEALFQIKDNGKGFDVQAGWQSSTKAGMGLLAMEERVRMLGGDLQLWSRKDQGTKITFTIPHQRTE